MHDSTQTPWSGARAPDLDHIRWLSDFNVLGDTGWRGKAVLDLGCGSGFLCSEAARQGARHVVGVDLEAPDVETKGWQFARIDLESDVWPSQLHPTSETGFDVILAFDILEHLSAPAKFIASCRTLLHPHGQLVVTTPNTSSWERWLRRDRWSGAQDPQHKVLFTRYSLGFLLRRCGFKPTILKAPVRKLTGLGIPSPDVGAQIFCQAVLN